MHLFEYVAKAQQAVSTGDPIIRPWETQQCPECGQKIGRPDGEHIVSSGRVLVGCEGFFVINPNVLGILNPNWEDWHK